MRRRAIFLLHGHSDEWFWGVWALPDEIRGGKVSLFDTDQLFQLFGPAEKRWDSVDEAFEDAKAQLAALGSDIGNLPVYCEGYYVTVMHECRIEDGRLVLPDDLFGEEEE